MSNDLSLITLDDKEAQAYSQMPDVQLEGGRLVPKDLKDLFYICRLFARSGFVPRDKQDPGKILVASQFGAALGMDLMASIQNIAVIGNVPSVWGDAMLAKVRTSGLLEEFVELYLNEDKPEMSALCYARRKDVGEKVNILELRKKAMPWPEIIELLRMAGYYVNNYSMADAKAGGYLSKDGSWQTNPKRMIKMRSRAFTLRDGFGDVLKGMHMAEEMMGEPQPNGGSPGPAGPAPGVEKEKPGDLAARLKEKPIDIKPVKVETLPGPAAAPPPAPPENPKAEPAAAAALETPPEKEAPKAEADKAPELTAEDRAALEDLKTAGDKYPLSRFQKGGDIDEAYSGDWLNKNKIRKPFMDQGSPWTTVGAVSGGDHPPEAEAWRLVDADQYKSEIFTWEKLNTLWNTGAKPRGDHGGQAVEYRGKRYVMVEGFIFKPGQPPIEAEHEIFPMSDWEDSPAEPPAALPDGDPALNEIAELETKIKAFIQDEAGLETDKARKYWTGKVLAYLLGQCHKANAAVKQGEPMVVSLADIYARFLKAPAENLSYIKKLFDNGKEDAGSGRETLATTKRKVADGGKRAKVQDPLPGMGKDSAGTSADDELAALKARVHEIKAKDADHIRLVKAAKNLQMGINPLTAEGFRRLLAEYDRLTIF